MRRVTLFAVALLAVALCAVTAPASARDATALPDQPSGHGTGETTAEEVRAMLGLADRGRVLDLFEMILGGDAPGALAELGRQYADGADPMAVMRDLAEITHWLSVAKIGPEALDDPTLATETRARGQQLADKLGMRVLSRAWQLLLKELEAEAPNSATPPAAPSPNGGSGPTAVASRAAPPDAGLRLAASGTGGPTLAAQPADPLAAYPDFASVVELIRARRDMKLVIDVEDHVRLVSYTPGRIEFHAGAQAPSDLAQRLRARLEGWTAARWAVSIASAPSDTETLSETRARETAARHAKAAAHPLVAAAMAAFPGAEVSGLRTPDEIAAEARAAAQTAALDAQDEQDDGWDPFEDE